MEIETIDTMPTGKGKYAEDVRKVLENVKTSKEGIVKISRTDETVKEVSRFVVALKSTIKRENLPYRVSQRGLYIYIANEAP